MLVQTVTLVSWPNVVGTLEQAFSLSAGKAYDACAALLADCQSALKSIHLTALNNVH